MKQQHYLKKHKQASATYMRTHAHTYMTTPTTPACQGGILGSPALHKLSANGFYVA